MGSDRKYFCIDPDWNDDAHQLLQQFLILWRSGNRICPGGICRICSNSKQKPFKYNIRLQHTEMDRRPLLQYLSVALSDYCADERRKESGMGIVILEVVLSVGFAELSYRFIETPVRHGIIGEYIGIINSRPHNRRERHRQIQVARRSLKAMAAVLATGLALSLCIAFVPKKTTLDTVAKREKKATEVTKLTNQKLKEQKAKKTAKTSKSTMTDEELLKNVQMLLIGDSITVDVTDYFYKVLPNSISDTKIGRSTLTGVKVFDEYQTQKKWDGDGVIFALGTNGPMYDTLGRIRQKVGDKPLFLTTVHAPKEDFESSNNEEIRKFVKEHEHTYLIDWYTASADHPEYFDQDDTHLLPKGAEAYAQCIKDAVLKAMRAEEKVNDKV